MARITISSGRSVLVWTQTRNTCSYIHSHGTLQETPQRTPCKSPLRLRSLFRLLPRRLTTFKKTAQQQAIMAATLCCRGSPSCLAKTVQQSAVQHWARAWTQFEAEATQWCTAWWWQPLTYSAVTNYALYSTLLMGMWQPYTAWWNPTSLYITVLTAL